MVDLVEEAKEAKQIFNVVIAKPFDLSKQNKTALMRLRDEIMDKVKTWEARSTTFFREYHLFTDSWRVRPQTPSNKKPAGLFNSKSGETHRAVETQATLWTRMLTAADPPFEAVAQGTDDFGREPSEQDLYAAEQVIVRQLYWSRFKEKLLRWLRSLSLFGISIFEEPFVSIPHGGVQKRREYTDLLQRSAIQTGFDLSVLNPLDSDFIFTIDFPTKWRLRNWSTADDTAWSKKNLENALLKNPEFGKMDTSIWQRIQESKQRAGYESMDMKEINEFINYHGRLETDNSVIRNLWDHLKREDDPRFVDFSVGLLNVDGVVKLHVEQYGDWRTRFKIGTVKQFEVEPYPYGVGKIGRKPQREQDITQSRINDLLMFGLYSPWKVGRFAGLKSNQLNIRPHMVIELEDINQLERVGIDIQALQQGLQMLGISQENFRNTVGAQTNLQAQITKASATESAIAQNEAIRGNSVQAETISDVLRDHYEQMHLNNLTYLDENIWVSATGEPNAKGQFYNRTNLPTHVGFIVKMVTDKDFRPERAQRLLEGLNVASSVRNDIPPAVNALMPVFEEWFRAMGMNPRKLKEQVPVEQIMQRQLQRVQGNPELQNEIAAEMAGDASGGGTNVIDSPVGPVATSPNVPGLAGGI